MPNIEQCAGSTRFTEILVHMKLKLWRSLKWMGCNKSVLMLSYIEAVSCLIWFVLKSSKYLDSRCMCVEQWKSYVIRIVRFLVSLLPLKGLNTHTQTLRHNSFVFVVSLFIYMQLKSTTFPNSPQPTNSFSDRGFHNNLHVLSAFQFLKILSLLYYFGQQSISKVLILLKSAC